MFRDVEYMVDFTTSFTTGFLATFIPLYLGLFAPRVLAKVWKDPRLFTFLAASSAGIIFWFFLDVMGGAALLDVNQGFNWSLTQTALVILFPLGVGTLLLLERKFSLKASSQSPEMVPEVGLRPSSSVMGITFAIAAVSALGIGFHALGEGLAIGVNIPSQPSILDAIGGILPGVAYVLHKFLEGLVIGVFALLATSTSTRKLGVLGAISGVPTLIGFFVGLAASVNTTFFFALGGAGALYIEIKLIPLFTRNKLEYTSMIPLLMGFYSMYIAGLFHG